MASRRVPPPKLKGPWEHWIEAVEEALEDRGSWSGSHTEVLSAAQRKLLGRSMRELEQSTVQGWDTPEGLLARWIRLHRVDWEVIGDLLMIKARVKVASKLARRPPPTRQLGLFEEEE